MQTFMTRYTDLWNAAAATVPSMTVVPPQLTGPPATWWLEHVAPAHRNLPDPAQIILLEHIHCYFLELGGVFAALDQICRRFAPDVAQPPARQLARFDVSPLHTAAELLWGYKEDRVDRTTQAQRRMEYLRQYGLDLFADGARTRAFESRPQFLQYLHTVLNASVRYFRENDDNTVTANPFPVLSALRPLHMLLAATAHNQYQFITAKARVELMVVEQILSLGEVQRFLGAPLNVPYPAPWMGAMDCMRRIMGWGDTSITEFYNLGWLAELILLTVRFGPFNPAFTDSAVAGAWALALRPAIEQYVYSYKSVTGVDLGADSQFSGGRIDQTPPAVYLNARTAEARLSLPSHAV